MHRCYVVSAVISLVLLLLPSAVAPAMAAPFTGGTMGWTIVGQPSIVQLNGSPTGKVTYVNTVNATTLGVVLLVLHNGMGQTVYISAATANIATGANSTAYDVIYGVQSGTYTATFFVELPSGTAMSVPTSISVTI